MTSAPFTSAKSAYDFIMAGNATITLVSRASGQRYTFKVRKPDDHFNKDGQPDSRKKSPAMYFVSLLAGPDNTQDYQYVGMVLHNEFRLTAKSRMNEASTPVKAFKYAFNHLLAPHCAIPANLEIWHEGRCGRCGRALTVPESIQSGFGPECIGKLFV